MGKDDICLHDLGQGLVIFLVIPPAFFHWRFLGKTLGWVKISYGSIYAPELFAFCM